MSFVPLQGIAHFHVADPPRDSEVEFTGPQRTLRLPIRGALPVLTRALRVQDAHASVGLLSSAVMLALKLVAAGKVRRADSGTSWQVGPLRDQDVDRLRTLATARAYDGLTPVAAETLIRQVLDAVADTMTRQPARTVVPGPAAPPGRGPVREATDQADLPSAVFLTLRIEAPEEQLLAGRLLVVPQVHDEADPAHFTDLEALWLDDDHGFARTARPNATVALRRAAAAWPALERLLHRAVPDRISLEGEELAELLESGLEALAGVGVDVFWPRGLRQELLPRAGISQRRGGGSGEEALMDGLFGPDALFEFDWRLALGTDPLTDEEMRELARATSPVIKLRDNWMVIDPALARRARRRRRTPIRPIDALRATLTGTLELDGDQVAVHPGASLERLRSRILDAAVLSPLDPPAGLTATLRDYQRQGLTWLAELTGVGLGACLADDMGLGKTVTVIALHLHRRERGLASGPTLVVCPASLIGNWEAEVRRFAPGVPTRRFHGAQRDLGFGTGGFETGGFETGARAPSSTSSLRSDASSPSSAGSLRSDASSPSSAGSLRSDASRTSVGADPGFVFTTYGTMRVDHKALGQVAWDLVVADEAQHIKNPASSTARNLRTIGSRCRVALTGTPVENSLTELWAILDWATPGLLGSRNAFRRTWAAPIESGVDPSVARRFAQLVEPFLLRRRKADPGIAPELPRKTETDHAVGLTREQVVLYEALVRDSMQRIESSRTGEAVARRGLVLQLLTGLKQICNHPAHYLRQANGRLRNRSEKLELLDELLGTIVAEGGSVLVFTQYVAMARLLERHLAEAGTPTLFLHGGTPVRAREQMVADFQAGAAPVFLLSLKSGGTGLNLTRADHVIHFDRWWNPAVEDQATDRAYRIGQTRPVQVHRLVTEGTIEQKIGELMARKRSLADAVLGSGETALTELSDDELRDLVRLRSTGDVDE